MSRPIAPACILIEWPGAQPTGRRTRWAVMQTRRGASPCDTQAPGEGAGARSEVVWNRMNAASRGADRCAGSTTSVTLVASDHPPRGSGGDETPGSPLAAEGEQPEGDVLEPMGSNRGRTRRPRPEAPGRRRPRAADARIASDGRRSRPIALGFAVLMLIATFAWAAAALPSRVHVYFTPTAEPDAIYDRWLFLLLAIAAIPVIAFIFMKGGSAVYEFSMDVRNRPSRALQRVRTHMAAWALVWWSCVICLAVVLGNGQPTRRSSLELLSLLVAAAGIAMILAWHLRPGALRAGSLQRQRRRSGHPGT